MYGGGGSRYRIGPEISEEFIFIPRKRPGLIFQFPSG